jgi:hypothetical protein
MRGQSERTDRGERPRVLYVAFRQQTLGRTRVAAQWGEGDPFKVQGSRSIIIATCVGMRVRMDVGMHDHSTPRSYHTTGMVDAPGTVDYGISVSTVDNHGCHESGDG